MERIRADFDEMKANMSDEVRETYGDKYIDEVLASVEQAKSGACFDTMRVIKTVTEALFVRQPKMRYFVSGGTGLVDKYVVSYS